MDQHIARMVSVVGSKTGPTTIKGPTWQFEMPAERTVTAYLCETDWNHELGHASDGNALYPSVDDLRDHQPCADQCGIVEVEVRLKRVVSPGKITVATHTPGEPDGMRDFLTHKPPAKKRKKAGRK
jgi:hypothetical protein